MFIFSNQRFLVIKLFYSSVIVFHYLSECKSNYYFLITNTFDGKKYCYNFFFKNQFPFFYLILYILHWYKNIFWHNLSFSIIDFILQTVLSGGRSVSIEEYPIRQEKVFQKKNVGECYIFLFHWCRKGWWAL